MSTPTVYPALSVTAPTTTTGAQNLLTLLTAKDTALGGSGISPHGREITIQNDPASTTNIRVGTTVSGYTLSTTNCGYVLTPGTSRTYRAGDDSGTAAILSQMYVVTDSSTVTAQLNVEIVRF